MNYQELIARARFYAPAHTIDALLPRHGRKLLRRGLGIVTALSGGYVLLAYVLPATAPHSWFAWVATAEGLALISAGSYLLLLMLEFFYNSFYFNEIDPREEAHNPLQFELTALVPFESEDSVYLFVSSSVGREILLRAGMSSESITALLKTRGATETIPPDARIGAEGERATLSTYTKFLLEQSTTFSEALFSAGVKEEDVLGAAAWYEHMLLSYKHHARVWGRDYLGRIPSFARDWSYGKSYALARYASYMRDLPQYFAVDAESARGKTEMRQLENILARTSGANALIVGSEGSGALEIVAKFAHSIDDGSVLPALGHKEVIVFNGEALVTSAGDKIAFERSILEICNQSQAAGNVILVMQHFSAFMESARTIGSDVLSVIEPYLTSPVLQMVLIVEPDSFYKNLEGNPQIMSHFEVIKVEIGDVEGTVHILEEEARVEEYANHVLFTYPALVEIVQSGNRYFPGSVMPDKAIDLLHEVVPALREKGRNIVMRQDVLDLVETKTGIPLSAVKGVEKEKLLSLEKILHERVVGQDEAVKSVADAMRRARAGITSKDRPMGLFLFLGPTGVGKTETAKALSDLFFGEKHPMLRLDMTEYSAPDAVDKLIGSFEANRPGVLALMLEKTPYGVLLLDEFEKASAEVKNLFLQVFDEGMFSDKAGKKINARNVIIIATSNAGSELIWDYFKKGEDVSTHKKELIDAIIHAHIFTPELMNRFDGVVVFHPLDTEGLRSIATMMLKKFAERLRRDKGIGLTISDPVVSYVMQFGVDEQFGARPMNRAIQDTVEKVIAQKIITGDLKAGSKLELSVDDLREAA